MFTHSRADSWWHGSRRAKVTVWVTAAIALLVLVVLGTQLHGVQDQSRKDLESRYRARAEVTAALTATLFGSVASSPDSAKLYGTPVVTDRTMNEAVKAGHLYYEALLDEKGAIIASSSRFAATAPAGVTARTASLR